MTAAQQPLTAETAFATAKKLHQIISMTPIVDM